MMPNDVAAAPILEVVQILLTQSSQRGYAGPMAKTFVGSRVRQLRSERGFSQAALAQMLDISASYLNQIEHDVRPLTVAVLLRITEGASQTPHRFKAEFHAKTAGFTKKENRFGVSHRSRPPPGALTKVDAAIRLFNASYLFSHR